MINRTLAAGAVHFAVAIAAGLLLGTVYWIAQGLFAAMPLLVMRR